MLLTPATASAAGRATATTARCIHTVRARRGDASDVGARSLAVEPPALALEATCRARVGTCLPCAHAVERRRCPADGARGVALELALAQT